MKAPRWILLVALLSLIALIAYWIANHFERYEIEHKTGQQTAARTNSLLAAERFLQRMGLSATPVPDLLKRNSRLPADSLLIIDAQRTPLGERGHQRLLDWVRGGGQLMVEAPATLANSVSDPILRVLKVESSSLGDTGDSNLPTRTRDNFGLEIKFDPSRVMHTERDDMQEAFGDDNGYHILRFALGSGSVTLFSDLDWLRNEHLGEQDHARFLYRIASNTPDRRVLLAHDLRSPSLLARLL